MNSQRLGRGLRVPCRPAICRGLPENQVGRDWATRGPDAARTRGDRVARGLGGLGVARARPAWQLQTLEALLRPSPGVSADSPDPWEQRAPPALFPLPSPDWPAPRGSSTKRFPCSRLTPGRARKRLRPPAGAGARMGCPRPPLLCDPAPRDAVPAAPQ